MSKKVKVTCPNCGAEAVKLVHKGQTVIACQAEKKVYALTETGHKLLGRDWFGDIEERVNRLESFRKGPEETVDDDDGATIQITWDDGDEDGDDRNP